MPKQPFRSLALLDCLGAERVLLPKKGKSLRLNDGPAPDYKIRLVYFVANDRKPTPDYDKKIRVLMHLVDDLYRSVLQAQGHKFKGLPFEMAQGEPRVHLVNGNREAALYNMAPCYDGYKQWGQIYPEIRTVFDPDRYVVLVFAETYDDGPAVEGWPGGLGLGQRFSSAGGLAMVSAAMLRKEVCATSVKEQLKLLFDDTPILDRHVRFALGPQGMTAKCSQHVRNCIGGLAHELGHAFGLLHDFRDDWRNIMGNGFRNVHLNFQPGVPVNKKLGFFEDNTRLLLSCRHIAADLDFTDNDAPTVEVKMRAQLKAGTKTVKIKVDAADDRGLRAIVYYYVHTYTEGGKQAQRDGLVGSRKLQGKKQSFDEELSLPIPLKAGELTLEIMITDNGGNMGWPQKPVKAEVKD